jgi:hypothetical protein
LHIIAVLSFLGVLSLAMNAGAQDADPYPPLVPDGERVAPSGPEFVSACLAQLEDRLKDLLGIQLLPATQLVTQSDRWGTVFRMDFEVAGIDPKWRVNRIICWQRPDGKSGVMFAIGQHVPPLQPQR